MVRLGIIGDVHLAFNDRDVAYFNASDLDVLLFVGDLAKYTGRGGRRISRVISRLKKKTLVIPGNHDNVTAVQMLTEALGLTSLSHVLGRGQGDKVGAWKEACGPVTVCGYSLHPMEIRGECFDVIAARPHSMGGNRLHFKRYLNEAFSVDCMQASVALLKRLIDASQHQKLLFLAHNGPSGLGGHREDIWGCDFRAEEGDHGDPDLEEAIDYARSIGKSVVLVAAGHMHRKLRGGGERQWQVRRDGTVYLNAALVPRIVVEDEGPVHHHVRVDLKGDTVTVSEVAIR